MKVSLRLTKWYTRLLLAGILVLAGLPVAAQTVPTWLNEISAVSNPYLILAYYNGTDTSTKWELWLNGGDPFTPEDNFDGFCVSVDANGVPQAFVPPWLTSRLFGAPHPHIGNDSTRDQRPYGTEALFRIDDGAGGFNDVEFPDGFTPVFSPPVPPLPRFQGAFAPHRIFVGDDLLEVTQKLQFARDLLRVEYIVRNLGQFGQGGGGTHRVGLRLVIDPYVDWNPRLCVEQRTTDSAFIPDTLERVLFEKDWGRAVGTGTPPRNAAIPTDYMVFDDDMSPDPLLIAKVIMNDLDATPPDRFAVVNTLNLYPAPGVWNYSTDFGQELRISDIGSAFWWDVSDVAPGRSKSFVLYAGLGKASHGVSNAYMSAQRDPTSLFTQGYVAAVHSPFALPLVGGNADVDAAGSDMVHDIWGFMQNEYFFSTLPGAFAFLELPDALALAGSSQSQRIDIGTLDALALGFDEGSGQWQVKATGVEAGIVDVNVTFSNSFLDSTRVTRKISVPQGRLYEIGPDWRMLTFPFDFTASQDDPATVLGLPPGSFQIIRYNSAVNQYQHATRIIPGESYWVRLLGAGVAATPVRLNNASAVNLQFNDTYLIELKSGWNQIGNPSPYAVPVKNIGIVNSDGRILTFDEAVSLSFIKPALYEYDRKRNRYERRSANDILQPGRGYWIFANAPRTLAIRGPYGPGIKITP